MATLEMNPASGVGAAIIVAGDPDPDSTGYYYEDGTWNDWRYYARHDDAYYLWSRNDNQHFITTVLDQIGPGFWWNPNNGPAGVWNFGAPYSGNPIVTRKPNINPLGDGTTVIRRNRNHWRPRRTGQRKAVTLPVMAKIERVFTRALALWMDLSPAMRLIWVGDGSRPLTARNRKRCLDRGLRRWLQVQMPLLLAGLPPEASTKQRVAYEFDNLRVTQINILGTRALLEWRWRRGSTIEERVVLHVSQLRRELVHRDNPWKYARLIASFDYPVWMQDPGWQDWFEWVPLAYIIHEGDDIQLYARVELMNNPNPPVSKIGSLMTTEDWEPLFKTKPP